MAILLSIVIPVYNVEKYIKKCLDSIFSQTVDCSMFEVIVVNDGTPDGSVQVINDNFNLIHNLRVLEQNNQGLSGARNTGLKNSKGKYVWFVDSDDWISPDAIETIINSILLYKDVDCFVTDIIEETEDTHLQKICYNTLPKELQIPSDVFFASAFFLTPMQKYIIRKDLLVSNALYFRSGIYHEDVEFLPRLFMEMNNLVCLQDPIYYYLIRKSGSITASFKKKNVDDNFIIVKDHASLYDAIPKNRKVIFSKYQYKEVMHIFRITRTSKELTEYMVTKYWKDLRCILQKVMKWLPWNFKVRAIIAYFAPRFYSKYF